MSSSLAVAVPSASTQRGVLARVAILGMVAILYLVAAQTGFLFVVAPSKIAAVWPAAGVAVAAMILVDRRLYWPMAFTICATNLAANLAQGQGVAPSLRLMSIAAVELLVISGLARWQGAPGRFADDVPTVLRVFFGPLAIGAGLGALIGGPMLARQTGGDLVDALGLWFIADGLAILVVAPMAIFWHSAIRARMVAPNRAEGYVLTMLSVAIAVWVFGAPWFESLGLRRPYVLFPIYFCCALYCAPHLTMTSVGALAFIGIHNTLQGFGLFSDDFAPDWLHRIRNIQSFMFVLAGSSLLLIALVRSKQRAETLLLRSHDELGRKVWERTRQLERSNQLLQREIQAREEVAERLESSESRAQKKLLELETIYRTATVGMCVLDQDLRYVRINERLAEMNRIPLDAHLNQPVERVLPSLPPEVYGMLRHVLETGEEIRDFEVSVALPDEPGRERHFRSNYFPIETSRGRCVGAVVEETTERLALEREVEGHRNDLTHAARVNLLGGLAGGLAHELNQPLHAISNYAQGCLRRLAQPGANSTELAAAVSEINRKSHRAAEILRRLRDLVKKRPPRTTPLDLSSVVNGSIRLLKGELAAQQIQVSCLLSADLPRMHGDAIQLEQVVLNLLMNAVEALKSNPPEERAIEIEAACSAGGIELMVRDNGPGLRSGEEELVFEHFYSTRDDGLGMGLAIGREIVERHGGTLKAGPNGPRGAAFRMFLPIG